MRPERTPERQRLLYERFEQIRLANPQRQLLIDEVLADARHPDSPLHAEYEWDPVKAHPDYLKWVTRDLIRSVRVEVITRESKVSTVVYVHDPRVGPQEQAYTAAATLRSEPAAAREALVAECKVALAYLRRARDVAVAVGLEGEVDGVLEQLGVVIEHADQ
jgi:hypothetical protein